MDGSRDALQEWANRTLGNAPKTDNSQAKEKIYRAAQRAKTLGYEIPDDIAGEFYDLTSHESGRSHYLSDGKTVKTGVRTPNGDYAIGFSQVMGNTAKPYKSKGLDPYKEEDNLIIGLNEFYNGDKADPIGRRLAYVGGGNTDPKRGKINRALAEYRQNGEVSDGKLYSYLPNNKETFADYVSKSGGYKKLHSWADQTLNSGTGVNNQNLLDWADSVLQPPESAENNLAVGEGVTFTTDKRTGKIIPLAPPSPTNPVNALPVAPEQNPLALEPIAQPPITGASQVLTPDTFDGRTPPAPTADLNLPGVKPLVPRTKQPFGNVVDPTAAQLADAAKYVASEDAAPPTEDGLFHAPTLAEQAVSSAAKTQTARKFFNQPNAVEAKNDAEISLKANAGTVAVNLANKPKGANAADYIADTTAADLAAKYELSAAEQTQLRAKLLPNVLSYYRTLSDKDLPADLKYRQAHFGDTNARVDVPLSYIDQIIRQRPGGDPSQLPDELRTAIGLQENTLRGGLDKNNANNTIIRNEEQADNRLRESALTAGINADGTLSLTDTNNWKLAISKFLSGENTATDEERRAVVNESVDDLIKNAGSARRVEALQKEYADLDGLQKTVAHVGDFASTIARFPASFAYTGAWLEDTAGYLREKLYFPTITSTDVLNSVDWLYAKSFGLEAKPQEQGKLPTLLAEAIEKGLPDDPRTADTLIGKISRGAGSAVPFLIGATLTGGSSVAIALLGIGSTSGDLYKQAKGAGLSREKQLLAGLAGVPIGASELAGLKWAKLGELISKRSGGVFLKSFTHWLYETGKEATEESVQEFFQNAASSATVSALKHNGLTKNDISEAVGGSLDDALTAGITGAIFGGGVPLAAKVSTLGGNVQTGQGENADLPESVQSSDAAAPVEETKVATDNLPIQDDLQSNLTPENVVSATAEIPVETASKVGQTVQIKNRGAGVIVEDRGGKYLVEYDNKQGGKGQATFRDNQVEFNAPPLPAAIAEQSPPAENESINTLADNPALAAMKDKFAGETPAPVENENRRAALNDWANAELKKPAATEPNLRENVFTKTNGDKIKLEDFEDFVVKRGSVSRAELQRNFALSYGESQKVAEKIKQVLGDNVIKDSKSAPEKVEALNTVNEPLNESAPVSDLRERVKKHAPNLFGSPSRTAALLVKPANLSRNFRAGTNDATLIFHSENQKDLYDLAAKEKYQMRGGQNKTFNRAVGDIDRLKQKLVKSGIDEKHLSARASEVYDDVRSQMKGVKHLEERQVKDNVLSSAGLKKTVAEPHGETAERLRDLAKNLSKNDILPRVESRAANDEIQVTPEAAEIVRIANAIVEDADIETAPPLSGIFLDPQDIKDHIEVLDELANQAAQNGENRAPLDELINNIRSAAKQNGTVIISAAPESVPHERFHQASYLSAFDKSLAGRHADFDALVNLKTGDGAQTILDKAHQTFFDKNGYSKDNKGVLVEEVATYAVTGNHEALGLSDEEAEAYLTAWFDSYVAKNGAGILDNVKEFTDERAGTAELIKRSRAGKLGGSGESLRESEVGRESERDERVYSQPESEKTGGTIEPDGKKGGLKERRTVVSAENAGTIEKGAITGEARYYETKSRVETERKAQERIENIGLAQAVAEALNREAAPSAEHAAHQLETVKLLNRQADEATAQNNPVFAKAKLNQAVEIMLALAPEGTAAGQFISQLASMNKTDPDTVAGYVQKRRAQKQYNEPLTPEQSKVLRETAENLQDANDRVKALQDKISELEKQLARDEKETIETKKGQTKPLSKVEKIIAENLSKKAEEAADRLKRKFAEPKKPTLKMIAPLSESKSKQLDEDVLKDFSVYGADVLLQGLKGKPMTILDFAANLTDTFGNDIKPHIREIHALSVKELQRAKKEAYRNNAVQALRSVEGNQDLSLEDLNKIVDKQTEDRKEKSKVRAEHGKEANKYFKEKNAFDDLDDLPSFAKSLFKVADTKNKEVLVGALYLETGKTANVNELTRELRKVFPNLSAREALNAATFAARSRVLAHNDLKIERLKLKTTVEKTKTEAAQIRRERNQIQRQLLGRINSLESPPPGYSARIAKVYKSAMVAAVQTTVNNFMTAQGSRKIEAVSDLAEVLINKSLARIGKEYGYENKLSGQTRITDIFSFPASEDYSVAGVTKHFFTDAVFARGIANSVLDEYPTFYEAMFGSYSPDVAVLDKKTGAGGAVDSAVRAVEKTYDAANFLNSLQEFLVRSQEFNYALQLRLGAKNLNLPDIVKNNQIAEKISEEDLNFAVYRALRNTFALKPTNDTAFGKLTKLYQSETPAVVAPFLITFPNFLYNATRFVTDYAPAIGLAKAGYKGIKSKSSYASFSGAMNANINPRVAAQQLVGTALFLSALQAVRALGDDDKWYYLRIPYTKSYIDVRGYQPFASMIFLANKMNRASLGKTMFTDKDAAIGETLEALTGFSSRGLEESKFGRMAHFATQPTGDDKDWERVGYLAQQQLGEMGGVFLRPLKAVKDLIAQFDDREAEQPDLIDRPLAQGIARNLPFSNRLLNADAKRDFVTGETSESPAPALKVLGVNIVNPDFHKEIPSKALVALRDMQPDYQSDKDPLPDSQRKAFVKSSIYRAMREAGDDKEKQKAVAAKIKSAENSGILNAGEIDYIERQKGVAEFENLARKSSYENIGRVYKVATEIEKIQLEEIVKSKTESANKRRDLTETDVAAIKKFMPEFEIDLKSPTTLYEKIKAAPTDKALQMYFEEEDDLTEQQKEDFKSFIKQKAENANKAGKLTDAEIENIKKVMPDFKVMKKLSSGFQAMPSKFGSKYESLQTQKPGGGDNKIRPFANFQNARQSENVIDERGFGVEQSRETQARWRRQRESENVIDMRPGSNLRYYLDAIKENNREDMKFWNREIKGFTTAERQEISKALIVRYKKAR